MKQPQDREALPHWELSNVFPGLESDEFFQAIAAVSRYLDDLEHYVAEGEIDNRGRRPADLDETGEMATGFLERMNAILGLYATIRNYLYSYVSTDSYNVTAKRLLSETDPQGVRIRNLEVLFRGWLGAIAQDPESWPAILDTGGSVGVHGFFLKESVEQSRYLMSAAEESLAAELNVSGANAWSKLQNIICSQLKAPFTENGKTDELPVNIIRTFLSDPDGDKRRQAYQRELAAWETVREPLAACLNGIKGTVSTLDRRRGRSDSLHHTLDLARIDREILEAMLSAMRGSFPAFRRYWQAKACRLGREQLPWWDIFAPSGLSERRLSFQEAQSFILEQFATFSDKLADFSQRAFESHWIDAEPRAGKTGGGFCMYIPGVAESRILVNYDGSMDQVMTVAHELGHAYHNECLKDKSQLQRRTPMTLAETASIFNQTIITDAALKQASEPDEELAILETFLIDSAQVVVDIYSRYLFESELFERRKTAELSADDLCDLMVRCQKETYADGLDQEYLNPYMWTWKPHYYNADRSYYNFPYTFGLLFGLGLYKIYQEGNGDFLDRYDDLLASTGNGTTAELAARFDIDLRQPEFWRAGIMVIEERIDRYIDL